MFLLDRNLKILIKFIMTKKYALIIPLTTLNFKVVKETISMIKSIKNLPVKETNNNLLGRFLINIINEFLKFR